MHLCLSCNQPCNISAVFCESCRLSLLERSAEVQQEAQAEERKVSGGDDFVDLASQSRVEASQSVLNAPVLLTERGRALFGGRALEMAEEEAEVAVSARAAVPMPATSALLVADVPVRRRMPKRVRRALIIFCVVGVLALSVDSVLLALSIMRHHVVRQSGHALTAVATTNPPKMPLRATSVTGGTMRFPFVFSSTHLLFTATQGQVDPQAQTILLLSRTHQPFAWELAPLLPQPSWLHVSAMQGSVADGTSAPVVVSTMVGQLAPGTYTANLVAKAFDAHGRVWLGSPPELTISLTVLAPCLLSVTPEKLSFMAVLLSEPSPQTLNITETGDCAQPIHWQVSANASWLTFSSTSGFGDSTITVQATSSAKLLGTSTASITLMATDAHGMPLADTPVTIVATLTVIA